MSEVEKWAWSRRFQIGTAIDLATPDDFMIVNQYGHKTTAGVSRNLNKLDMIDFLPVKVLYKNTGKGNVIIHWEMLDHPSRGDGMEQQDLDAFMGVE
jgi:hypothetical protein